MEHWRIPADDETILLLGRFAYNFAYYEWIVIYTIEALKPGFVSEYTFRPVAFTSGDVAKRFTKEVKEAPHLSASMRDKLKSAEERFQALVTKRNQIIHAHPSTAANGRQQLHYYSKGLSPIELTREDILQIARQVETAACDLDAVRPLLSSP
jgi:hypothetical protein